MTHRMLFVLVLLSACHGGRDPELRVIGVHDRAAHEIVFVQVTNPASRPMRLTNLTYKFAADGTTLSTGDLPLARDVPAESAIVVEVPLDAVAPAKPIMLTGTLTTELDRIVRSFDVSTQVTPH